MAKILVVYFSRTGTTQKAAKRLASLLDADVEGIVEDRDRRGVIEYLRAGYEAAFQLAGPYLPLQFDPKRYDLVVIATPIWNASLASPVRSYLRANRERLTRIATLITCGGMGMARVERQIEREAGLPILAAASLTDRDRKQKNDQWKIEDLARSIRELFAEERPRASVPSHA
jgi:flavodoxin